MSKSSSHSDFNGDASFSWKKNFRCLGTVVKSSKKHVALKLRFRDLWQIGSFNFNILRALRSDHNFQLLSLLTSFSIPRCTRNVEVSANIFFRYQRPLTSQSLQNIPIWGNVNIIGALQLKLLSRKFKVPWWDLLRAKFDIQSGLELYSTESVDKNILNLLSLIPNFHSTNICFFKSSIFNWIIWVVAYNSGLRFTCFLNQEGNLWYFSWNIYKILRR